ncbi:DUF2637 domain-containing protein [Actinoplanes regularis]|uniref:DUF2637 domain-containing protein n=1 Tax=Actinoplanes regularis TaxID=52697 RepID=A0A238XIS2_9ACTN|nr:DUF2637 domain-containing protein [Actinoplanes regularis]GIE90510.1 hypothetical protein Are01nite_69900 [Actinoplanes regularis]SNR58906.1 Protein of unknown function [Actinoplanes regularis]
MSVDLDAVTQLAGTDRRAARQLLDAQHAQAAASARIAAADADADRQLRVAEQQQRLAAQHRETVLREKEQARAARQRRRTDRVEQRQLRAQARRAWAAGVLAYLKGHADDAYAAVMYGLAVGGAVYGQISAATARGWPLAAGLVIAAAIEGLALVMALTAQKLRLAGEAARAPRALTWICAAAAAGINYLGHAHADKTGAVLLAALSLAGIIVWEIRSGATHRLELRKRGLLPEPAAVFGWRRWLRFPRSTLAAWSIDVRNRVSPRAGQLLETASAERRQRQDAADRRRVRRLARRTLRDANRSGDSTAVLDALTWFAEPDRSGPVRVVRPPEASLRCLQQRTGAAHEPGPGRAARATDGPDRQQARRRLWSSAGGPRLRPRRSGPALRKRPATPDAAQLPGPVVAGRQAADHGEVRSVSTTSASPAPGGGPAEPDRTEIRDHPADRGPIRDHPANTDRAARTGPSPAATDRTTHPGPADAAPVRPVAAALAPADRTAKREPVRSSNASADRSGRNRSGLGGQSLDVPDLMAAGRQVRDRLAADGVALSRSRLIKGIREQDISISTDRATALLAELRREARPASAGTGRR